MRKIPFHLRTRRQAIAKKPKQHSKKTFNNFCLNFSELNKALKLKHFSLDRYVLRVAFNFISLPLKLVPE